MNRTKTKKPTQIFNDLYWFPEKNPQAAYKSYYPKISRYVLKNMVDSPVSYRNTKIVFSLFFHKNAEHLPQKTKKILF
jgi:hypothetical protein